MKNNIIKALIAVSLLSIIAFVASCSNNASNNIIGPYYAEYGQVFVVPQFEGETTVNDSLGNRVAIKNGRFYVESTSNYSISVKIGSTVYSGNIIVSTEGIPVISADFDIRYALVNTNVSLPEVKAFVGGTSVEYTAIMKKGEQVIDISDGFFPQDAGEYHYTISAQSDIGKTMQKTVIFYVEDNNAFQNKITSFDKPYGVKQIQKFYGISAEYSQEYRYKDEAGSTKITVSTAEAEHEAMFALGNLHIKNWSNIAGIRFYVYNDNSVPVNVLLNWSNTVSIIPGQWTQFYISSENLSILEGQSEILSKFSVSSADGVNVQVVAPISGNGTFSLYFSAIYAGEKDVVTPAEVFAMVEDFIASADIDFDLQKKIENAYREFNAGQRQLVTNYAEFINKVEDFIKTSAEGADTNKIVHLDKDFGRHQLGYYNAIPYYSQHIKHGNDTGSTLIQTYGFYSQLDIVYPIDKNISEYGYLEFYIYNPNPKAYAVQIWDYQIRQIPLPARQWTKISIDVIDFSSTDQLSFLCQIFSGNWGHSIETDGAKFYISSITKVGAESATGAELKDKIDYLLANGFNEQDVIQVRRDYSLLPDSEKLVVDNYKGLLKVYYLQRDGVPTDAPHRLNYFDSEYGTEQVKFTNEAANPIRITYSKEIKYGNESGSLMVRGNTGSANYQIFLEFTEAEIANLSNYSAIKFYVYTENPRRDCRIGAFGMNPTAIELPRNEWTEVILPIPASGTLVGQSIRLQTNDGAHGVNHPDYRFYFSAFYGVEKLTTGEQLNQMIADLGDDITDQTISIININYEGLSEVEKANATAYRPFIKSYYLARDGVTSDEPHRLNYFDSEYGLHQIISTNTAPNPILLTYYNDPTYRYGNEAGSLMVTGNTGGGNYNIYLQFTDAEIGDLSNYSAIKFYVYTRNSYRDCQIHASLLNTTGSPILLRRGEWTEVILPVPASGTLVGQSIRLTTIDNANHGLNLTNYRFYFSAFYGVEKLSTGEQLNQMIADLGDDITEEDFNFVQINYDALSEVEKANATAYKPFIKSYYLTRDGVPTDAPHRLTYFDSEYGVYQVNCTNPTLEYSTEYAYGDEKGSLMFTGIPDGNNSWHITLTFTEAEIEDLSNYSHIKFYVLVRNPYRDCEIHNRGLNQTGQIPLPRDEWTEVILPIPETGFVGGTLRFRTNDTNSHGLTNTQYRFYLSAFYGVEK